ncbi:chemotaxis protein methyltransferase CheR [Vibrio cholerae]|nr:chemotaxis protein methyltransferase CheR [Vibrio cholerae]
MTAITISDQEYRDFCRFLESQCGIVLGDSKQYLVRSRLSPLVTKFKLSSLSDLLRDVVTGRNRDLRVAAVGRHDNQRNLMVSRFLPIYGFS